MLQELKKLSVVETLTIGSYAVSAIVNGDLSGLHDDDVDDVKAMIDYIGVKTVNLVEGDTFFATCEICNLKADCVEINLLDWMPFEYVTDDNYIDVAEALHAWLTLNHEGQSSTHYELLCKSQFKVGPLWSASRVEHENNFYNEITESNFEEIFNELEIYLVKLNL